MTDADRGELKAENERLREALRVIQLMHDGNPPMALADIPEIDYARRTISNIHAHARAALAQTEPAHPDDVAVDRFAAVMKAKLAEKRAEGRGGWDDPSQCSVEYLSALLRSHVDKGDPLDVGNFAMMIHQRGERIAPAQAEPVAWRWRFDDDAPWSYGTAKPGNFRFGDPGDAEPLYTSPPAPQPVDADSIAQIAIHLDCEPDADSILHIIRETQADLEIAKDNLSKTVDVDAIIERCAVLIDDNIIQDTSGGKVLAPRQDGNRDGLHYASAIRALKGGS